MQVLRKTLGLAMLATLMVGGAGVELAGASPGRGAGGVADESPEEEHRHHDRVRPLRYLDQVPQPVPERVQLGRTTVAASPRTQEGEGRRLGPRPLQRRVQVALRLPRLRLSQLRQQATAVSGPYLHLEPTRARNASRSTTSSTAAWMRRASSGTTTCGTSPPVSSATRRPTSSTARSTAAGTAASSPDHPPDLIGARLAAAAGHRRVRRA